MLRRVLSRRLTTGITKRSAQNSYLARNCYCTPTIDFVWRTEMVIYRTRRDVGTLLYVFNSSFHRSCLPIFRFTDDVVGETVSEEKK